MNRYILIDFEKLEISSINKIETDFEENENYTSSVPCINRKDLIKTLKEYIPDLEGSRYCDYCCQPMTQGYCIEDGLEYYCSQNCLNKHYTEEEYNEMYTQGNAYYTTWDD